MNLRHDCTTLGWEEPTLNRSTGDGADLVNDCCLSAKSLYHSSKQSQGSRYPSSVCQEEEEEEEEEEE